MMIRKLFYIPVLFLFGCAGFSRGCSSWRASTFGSDWLVAQYKNDGGVMRCWRLTNTSVENEHASDGIYWLSPNGHLVHISGWYNRVQVSNADWRGAAAQLNLDLSKCE